MICFLLCNCVYVCSARSELKNNLVWVIHFFRLESKSDKLIVELFISCITLTYMNNKLICLLPHFLWLWSLNIVKHLLKKIPCRGRSLLLGVTDVTSCIWLCVTDFWLFISNVQAVFAKKKKNNNKGFWNTHWPWLCLSCVQPEMAEGLNFTSTCKTFVSCWICERLMTV